MGAGPRRGDAQPRTAIEPIASSLVALLGPTNTGKTHRAIGRMLEHDSGMLGLPLRLLAREVYDRVSAEVGESAVALVTGEEKRVPRAPRYWICTVEAMPTDLEVDFVGVDEIQLVGHRERGHVFTERLLHARGRIETWFLGADTARPLATALAPTLQVRSHPRLSRLAWLGSSSLATLPPRSAVVAFGMSKVYELAERLRTKRGGAAVVLGALSPRARNAQVAMYQSGEVSYLVATDAIGMGLNLDLDHVAFAELGKFDGQERRPLEPAELAQIAGRAGRFVRDGTFGVLEPQRPLPENVVRSIEEHRFAPLRRAYYRNAELDPTSIASLLESLREPPRHPALVRVPHAEDTAALEALGRDPDVAALARGPERVRLLWDICRIPDYRQLLPEMHHVELKQIALALLRPHGQLDGDFMRARLSRLESTEGDIEDLLAQMAQVRTWTYVASHPGWVQDATSWQASARDLEDRLSDALHQRLILRFVDRGRAGKRSAVTRPRPRSDAGRAAQGREARALDEQATAPSGPFAKLLALRSQLVAQSAAAGPQTAPTSVDEEGAVALAEAPHASLELDAGGVIRFRGVRVGTLVAGRELLLPEARVTLDEDVSAGSILRVERRLRAFARDAVAELCAPLRELHEATRSAAVRGLLWQLERSLGTLRVAQARDQLALLEASDHEQLASGGVAIGQLLIVATPLHRGLSSSRRFALVGAFHRVETALSPQSGLRSSPGPASWPTPSATSARPGRIPPDAWQAVGFPVFGPRAIRADIAERAYAIASTTIDSIASIVGCKRNEEAAVRAAMGRAQTPARAAPDAPPPET